MPQSMTPAQLTEHIKSVVLPMIKDMCGAGGDVANAVQSAVEKSMATQTAAPPWLERVLGDNKAADTGDTKALEDGTKRRYASDIAAQRDIRGLSFGRYMAAIGAVKGRAGAVIPDMVVAQLKAWGDHDLAEMAVKAMSATNAAAGGFLVPVQFSNEVIEFLRARTVVRKTNGGPRIMPMPNGTMKLPKVTGGTQAAYVGEVQNMAKTEAQTGQVTLTFKKLAALVPFSNDLLRYSSPQADAIIRDDVVRAIMVKEDATFLRSQGTAGQPTGFRFLAPSANVLAATAGQTLANVISDLGKLIVQLLNNNVPLTRPAWYFAPRTWNFLMTVQNSNGFYVFREEMMKGQLWGWPFGFTTSVPINLTDQGGTTESEVYLVDLDDAVIGEAANLIIDVSNEAAYHDGANVISAFSQDTTVLRAIEEHDFAMRRQESVALLNGVTWT